MQENILKSILVKLFLSSLRSKIPPDQHSRYLVSRQNMVRIILPNLAKLHCSDCVWALRSTCGNRLEWLTVASVTFTLWMRILKSGGPLAPTRKKRKRKPLSAAPAFYSHVIDEPPSGLPSLQNSDVKTRKIRYFHPIRRRQVSMLCYRSMTLLTELQHLSYRYWNT